MKEQSELEYTLHTAWTAIRDARKEAKNALVQAPRNSKDRDTARMIEAALGRAENELDHAMSLQDPFNGLDTDARFDPIDRFYRPEGRK